jgi:uncharacterized protein YceH (UPF0502 family)
MSPEPQLGLPGSKGPWPILDMRERRVLGVLVEKAKTTPDAYPLSVNALVTGSNQKSNRDPIMDLSEEDVQETLSGCQRKGLVLKITGGRVVRWRHNLYEAWHLDKIDLALIAELLLRGPQTEGELRTRASRMEPLEDLDCLRAALRPLVERNLVFYLTPEGRGAVVTHGFHDQAELPGLRANHAAAPVTIPSPPVPMNREIEGPSLDARLRETQSKVAALQEELIDLRRLVQIVHEELRAFRQSAGG